MLNRRELLSVGTGGFVTLVLTRVLPACSSDDSGGSSTSTSPTTPACDGAGETSSVTLAHAHNLCVPASDLTSPPVAGVNYVTSVTSDHEHTVPLTQAMLTIVARGGVVVVTTSVAATASLAGHTHIFSVQMGQVTPAPQPGVSY